MNYRRLGKAGIKLSELSLGAWVTYGEQVGEEIAYGCMTAAYDAVVTADSYHPRRLRLTVSGMAPLGPAPTITGPQPTNPVTKPTLVEVTLQQRDPAVSTDLGWQDAPAGVAAVNPLPLLFPSLLRWTGTIDFTNLPQPGQYRLLIREYEYLSANYTIVTGPPRSRRPHRDQPRRLIYAETIDIDTALVGGPSTDNGTTLSS